MFKKKNFTTDPEDQDKLRIFKNIRKYVIHRVATHIVVFPCVDAITWILKHVEFGNRYICNVRLKQRSLNPFLFLLPQVQSFSNGFPIEISH
jgi:hypothetical protein